MIDTCVLALDGFELPKDAIYNQKRSKIGYDHFDLPALNKEESYVPRVFWIRYPAENPKRVVIKLCLEFSAPKLLYGNSIEEVDEWDYGNLTEKLACDLKSKFNLCVTPEQLNNAQLKRLDFCKNILLPIEPGLLFGHIRIFSFKQRREFGEHSFIGGGTELLWSAKKSEFVMYDKAAEVVAEGRPESIFALKKLNLEESKSLLRLEVRLTGLQIKKTLAQNGITEPFVLPKAWNSRIAGAILIDQLNQIVGIQCLSSAPNLIIPNEQLKKKDAFTVNSILCMARQFGMDQALKEHKRSTSPNTHRKIMKLLKNTGPPENGLWKIIEKQLKEFNPIKICQNLPQ